MEFDTIDIIKHKLQDTQEDVRDFQEYSKKVNIEEVNREFLNLAEESALQAQRLQILLDKYDRHK